MVWMNCPHCSREIRDLAIRCRHCRRAVVPGPRTNLMKPAIRIAGELARRAKAFFTGGKVSDGCPWSPGDVLVLVFLLWVFVSNDPFGVSSGIFRYLRMKFPVLIKEPRLFNYLHIYLGTIVFKALAMVLVFVLAALRRVSPSKTLLSAGNVPESWWRMHIPLYLMLCIIIRDISSLNPLIPNLPFDSVNMWARCSGSIVVIFSVVVVAPFTEEVIFRGFLYPAVNRYMGIHPAVFVTSALFTMAHQPQAFQDVIFALTIFLLSLMITYARALSGSTVLAIFLHLAYNLIYVTVGVVNYIIMRF